MFGAKADIFLSFLLAIAACFSVAKCKLHYAKDQKFDEEKFLVPNVPNSLEDTKYGSSRYVIVWSNRIHERNRTEPYLSDYDLDRPEPAIVVMPIEFHMMNLVPLDSPNPLYSSRFTKLTDSFLLDSMSTEYLDPKDKRLLSSEGLSLETMSGKDLHFEKDPNTGVMTVDGVAVERIRRIDGEKTLTIFEIDGFLFGYRLKIGKAFKILQLSSSEI